MRWGGKKGSGEGRGRPAGPARGIEAAARGPPDPRQQTGVRLCQVAKPRPSHQGQVEETGDGRGRGDRGGGDGPAGSAAANRAAEGAGNIPRPRPAGEKNNRAHAIPVTARNRVPHASDRTHRASDVPTPTHALLPHAQGERKPDQGSEREKSGSTAAPRATSTLFPSVTSCAHLCSTSRLVEVRKRRLRAGGATGGETRSGGAKKKKRGGVRKA